MAKRLLVFAVVFLMLVSVIGLIPGVAADYSGTSENVVTGTSGGGSFPSALNTDDGTRRNYVEANTNPSNYVSYLVPTGDSSVAWTAVYPVSPATHYDKVDEPGAVWDDTDYLQTATASTEDRFTMSDLATPSGSPNYDVTAWAVAKDSSSGNNRFQVGIRIATTNYLLAYVNPGTSYANYSITWTINPATSAEWTLSEIQALIGVITPNSDANPAPRCTQMGITIALTYTASYALDAQITFSDVLSIDKTIGYQVLCQGYRSGSENFNVQVWNYTSSAWVTKTTVQAGSDTDYNFNLVGWNANCERSSGNEVKVRIVDPGGDVTQDTAYLDVLTIHRIDSWAPTFTSSPPTTIAVNHAYSYAPTCNESVTFTADTKPVWATWSANTFGGTPTGLGSFDFKLKATSTAGTLDAWQNWSVVVSGWSPTITSTPSESGIKDVAYSYTVTANETSTFVSITKPAWASFASPSYSGTPPSPGTYPFQVRATSTVGTLTTDQYWNVTVVNTWAPTFTSSQITTGTKNVLYSYHITLNETGTITYQGAPSWLSISNSKNGTTGPWYLNGTPTVSGVYSIHLKGYSNGGLLDSYQNFSLTIANTWAPTFTNSAETIGSLYVLYSYQPTCNESVTYTLVTKPDWASLVNGFINGTPISHGLYAFELKSTSNAGTLDAWQNWTVSCSDAHLDDGGWEWHFDDTSDATKAILTRVVRVGTASTEVNIPEHLSGTIDLLTIENSCFSDVEGKKITKVLSMPSTVTLIKANAFINCNFLTSVVLGTGVTTLQTYVFAGCTALTSINIPASLTTIGGGVFTSCAFTSFTIPDTLSTVVNEFFYTCPSLTSVTIGTGVTSIGADAFYGCSALTSITFLSHDVPTVGANWKKNTNAGILGHAYSTSHFPVAPNYFPAGEPDVVDRLTMGDPIAPTDAVWISDTAKTSDDPTAWDVAAVPGIATNCSFTSAHVGACTFNQALALGTFTVGAGSPAISIAASVSTKGLTTAASTTLTVATTKVLTVLLYSGYTYSHAGTIAGAGTGSVVFELHNAAFTTTFGAVTCPATISLSAAAAASRICTLGANAAFTSTLTVSSAHAANTMTLNPGGYSLTATTIAASTRGIISSSVAGSKITSSAAITVSANGQLDATNIAWISCGTNWDSSAGTWKPGTNQVNMTATGSTKLAVGQYFYNLLAVNGGVTRTLLSNVVVQNHKNIIGTLTQGAYSVTINGTNVKPLEANGTWSGVINITSTGATYTIYTAATWTGTVQASKVMTVIYTGGQLVITPPASTWYNVTMRGWTGPNLYKWYAGSTTNNANLTFAASGLTGNANYHVYLDEVLNVNKVASAGGVVTYYHITWSGHFIRLEFYNPPPIITSGAPGTSVNEDVAYCYTATSDQSGTWTVTGHPAWLALTIPTPPSNWTASSGTPHNLDVGASSISFSITNANGTAYLNWTLTVVNVAPVFNNGPNTQVGYGWRYYYHPYTDEDGQGVTYSLVTNSLDVVLLSALEGDIQGKIQDCANFWVNITANDGNGGLAYQNYTVQVNFAASDLRILITNREGGFYRVSFDFMVQNNKEGRGALSKVTWNFGDGLGSKDWSPVHTYEKPGYYSVTVAVFDEKGTVGYTVKEITVGDPGNPPSFETRMNWWLTGQGLAFFAVMVGALAVGVVYTNHVRKRGGFSTFTVVILAMAAILALWMIGSGSLGL